MFDMHLIFIQVNKWSTTRSTDSCQGDQDEFERTTDLDETENDANDCWNGVPVSV